MGERGWPRGAALGKGGGGGGVWAGKPARFIRPPFATNRTAPRWDERQDQVEMIDIKVVDDEEKEKEKESSMNTIVTRSLEGSM